MTSRPGQRGNDRCPFLRRRPVLSRKRDRCPRPSLVERSHALAERRRGFAAPPRERLQFTAQQVHPSTAICPGPDRPAALVFPRLLPFVDPPHVRRTAVPRGASPRNATRVVRRLGRHGQVFPRTPVKGREAACYVVKCTPTSRRPLGGDHFVSNQTDAARPSTRGAETAGRDGRTPRRSP